MLSLAQCRKFLPSDLSDEEVDHLRTQLYALAEIATTEFLEHLHDRSPHYADDANQPGFRAALSMVHRDRHDEICERAAILEFDAGIPREEAELDAFREVISRAD